MIIRISSGNFTVSAIPLYFVTVTAVMSAHFIVSNGITNHEGNWANKNDMELNTFIVECPFKSTLLLKCNNSPKEKSDLGMMILLRYDIGIRVAPEFTFGMVK